MLLDNKMMCDQFKSFCKQTALYPIVAMNKSQFKFASEKEEKRITLACEPLYALSNTLLPDMRNSYRELSVDYMFEKNIKHEYLAGSIGRFSAYLDFSLKSMLAMYKKEPILKAYYDEHFAYMVEFSKQIFELMKTDTVGDQSCIDMYQREFKSTIAQLKERYKA